jgi:hypothetical protein
MSCYPSCFPPDRLWITKLEIKPAQVADRIKLAQKRMCSDKKIRFTALSSGDKKIPLKSKRKFCPMRHNVALQERFLKRKHDRAGLLQKLCDTCIFFCLADYHSAFIESLLN